MSARLQAGTVPVPDPRVRRGLVRSRPTPTWRLPALYGRLVEISAGQAGAPLTLAFRLVLEAQRRGEPVVWITHPASVFFPPDAAEAGVDLGALIVVGTSELLRAARAADHLLRSGAFGLVVMDLGARASLPLHAQTRLVGLAHKHGTALVCLTEKESWQPSVGSLVSLRAQAIRAERTEDRYRCEVRALKDKRGGPGWIHTEVCRGPDGLH